MSTLKNYSKIKLKKLIGNGELHLTNSLESILLKNIGKKTRKNLEKHYIMLYLLTPFKESLQKEEQLNYTSQTLQDINSTSNSLQN
jgi:hypothetical protein